MRTAAALRLCLLSLFVSLTPAAIAQTPASAPESDLDAFMAQVLQRRDEAWRQLHDYILDEDERAELRGPGDVLLFGQRRQYTWYVRDGYLVRSPLKFNGVTVPDAERKRFETDWLNEEKDREKRRAEKADRAKKDKAAASDKSSAPAPTDLNDLVREAAEPRFISEAYFMRFKFDPGNYYLVGREKLEQRDVLKIEYYPRKPLFEGMDDDGDGKKKHDKDKDYKEQKIEEDFERKFTKVALITLWVDPAEHQIVKYTFDNVDFGFLPGRWAVRVDDITASMVMSQPIEGIWLPREISMQGGFTLANGGYRVRYARAFSDYKQGEVRAKIRGYERRED